MDLLPAIFGSLPQLGGAGLLVLVVGLLLRLQMQSSERFNSELARVEAAHDAELAEKNTEIDALRSHRRELEAEVDEQRRLRRAAEDGGRHRAGADDGPPGPSPWAPG